VFLERCSVICQRQIIFSCSLLEGLCCSSLIFITPQRSGDIPRQISFFHYKLWHDFDSVLWIAVVENSQGQIYLIL